MSQVYSTTKSKKNTVENKEQNVIKKCLATRRDYLKSNRGKRNRTG